MIGNVSPSDHPRMDVALNDPADFRFRKRERLFISLSVLSLVEGCSVPEINVNIVHGVVFIAHLEYLMSHHTQDARLVRAIDLSKKNRLRRCREGATA